MPLFEAMGSRHLKSAVERLRAFKGAEQSVAITGLVAGSVWDEDRRNRLLREAGEIDGEVGGAIRKQMVSQWRKVKILSRTAVRWKSVPNDACGVGSQAGRFYASSV